MTNENKQLLIKGLCARLPYGVKYNYEHFDRPVQLVSMHSTDDRQVRGTWQNTFTFYDLRKVEEIKPYLFPLSSMTEEQYNEFNKLSWPVRIDGIKGHCEVYIKPYIYSKSVIGFNSDSNPVETDLQDYLICIDWLNKNHFDYRGLIKKGLAVDCTNLNIY